jgi:quercetin dioxygenase-like cupin family protein
VVDEAICSALGLLLIGLMLAPPGLAQESQATFVEPDQLNWKPTPFPGITAAPVAGNPTGAGMYVIFAKYAAGAKSPPHTHPDQRVVTVISGVFRQGIGSEINEQKMRVLPPGHAVIIPANTPHYGWAKEGEVVLQEAGMGPTGTNLWPKAAAN